MTKEMTEPVREHQAQGQVLRMAVSTLDTISALLGLSSLSEPMRARPAAAQYSLAEVAEHDSPDDCWLVLYDRVYDVTSFVRRHPGGADILLENAGRDASSAFHGVGHSASASDTMRQYQVGVLPPHQCMWTAK